MVKSAVRARLLRPRIYGYRAAYPHSPADSKDLGFAANIMPMGTFFVLPQVGGGVVIATSRKSQDKGLSLGAYPPEPGGWVWW